MFDFTLDCQRMSSTYTYWLLYNQSLVKQNFLDNMNAPLKMSLEALRTARQVENALANWILKDGNYTENPQVEHNFTYQDYPKVQSRIFSDFDTSSEQGTFWFFIPIMISFLSFNSELLKEKEKKLRQGLMLFGISSLAYLSSWVVFMLIFNAFFAAFLVGLAYVCQFSVFVNTPFFILWLCFYSLVCGFNSVSLWLVSSY
jgi:ABC-type multidrug transport system permease subunit